MSNLDLDALESAALQVTLLGNPLARRPLKDDHDLATVAITAYLQHRARQGYVEIKKGEVPGWFTEDTPVKRLQANGRFGYVTLYCNLLQHPR